MTRRRKKIYTLTDVGNAQRLADQFGQDLRYVAQWDKWLVWDGGRWKKDETGEIVRKAKETVKNIYKQVAAESDTQKRTKLAEHAKHSESEGRIRAMIGLAKSEPQISVTVSSLDADPMLLNCHNGTIDLQNGKLRQHRREDLLTKLTPVSYDANAVGPNWDAFLARIMANDQGLIKYLKRVIGYCLTGQVTEQCFFFLYGTGANGKSSLTRVILEMMGDYAKQAPPGLLVAKRWDSHPTEIADLAGCRLVACVEVENEKQMAIALMKQMTGGDRMKGRFMRQDFFEFEPTHKIFLAANQKPVVRDNDFGTWRRVKLIPFSVTIPHEEQDRNLFAKLHAELPGILKWAVDGCLEWLKSGLQTPEAVEIATSNYQSEMDDVANFVEESCSREDPQAITAKKDLYQRYMSWCDANGQIPLTVRSFGVRIIALGIQESRTNECRNWLGVRLLTE